VREGESVGDLRAWDRKGWRGKMEKAEIECRGCRIELTVPHQIDNGSELFIALITRSRVNKSIEQRSTTMRAYPTNDTVMRRQMRLAVLASEDPVRIQIHIVSQAHVVFLFSNYAQHTLRHTVGGTLGWRVVVRKCDGEGTDRVDVGVTMLNAAEARSDDGHRVESREVGGDVFCGCNRGELVLSIGS